MVKASRGTRSGRYAFAAHTHTRLHRTLSFCALFSPSHFATSPANTQVWEKQNTWGGSNPFSSRGSLGGSWDLRSAGASFRSPASLARIRSQAERVFNDSYSNSLFTSPALQRFKAQTDSMLADVQSFVNRSSLVSVVTDVRSSLMSWFY